MTVAAAAGWRDARVVGLVAGGHFFSHFYGLVLPPLFPLLVQDLGVGYAALGLLVSASALAAGVAQMPVGFLVDRIGPVPFLVGGMALQAGATLMMGLVPGYGALLALVLVAGVGGCVYHPADYAILAARIDERRLGRAFSVHGFASQIGWAVAPAAMGAAALTVGWRTGLVVAGAVGLIGAAAILANRHHLAPEGARPAHRRATAGGAGWGLFLALPILMCFAFFVLIAMATVGFDTFLVAALVASHATPFATANAGLTAFFVGSASGILAGGVLADRWPRHSVVAAVGFAVTAVLVVVVGEVSLSAAALIVVLGGAGFAYGLVPPSRDLLVRSVTPEGATGRVFAFVSVGLEIGAVATPLVYGWFMDVGAARAVFWATAALQVLAIATVVAARRTAAR